ncbi:MAG: hypothetical protein HZA52_19180 [Planctomycetes bacterium]|nr:hypothetical protein [Planctomycetota bacterium]
MRNLLLVAVFAGLALVAYLATRSERPDVVSIANGGASTNEADDSRSLATTETREQRSASAVAATSLDSAPTTELVADLCASVVVVDRAGRAVGDIAVALCVPEFDGWRLDRTVLTNEAGLAEFQGLEKWRDEHAKLRVGLSLARCEPEFVEFALAELPREPMRLVVEDSGTLEVRATESNGDPLGVPLTLWIATDADAPIAWPFSLALHDRVRTTSQDGTATFRHVGVGLPIVADAELEGAQFERRWIDGPHVGGEVVRVDVPLERIDAVFRAELVDEESKPLANVNGIAYFHRDRSKDRDGFLRFESDASGRVHTFVPTATWKPSAVVEVTFVGRRANEPGRRVRCLLPKPTRSPTRVSRDEYDFGVLVCVADPFFCAGQVLDTRGRPVADAIVTLNLNKVPTRADRDFQEAVDAEGRFVIGWTADADEVALMANAGSNRRSERVIAARGARGVVLTLPAAEGVGTLEGRVVLPDGVTMDHFDLSIERVLEDGSRAGCNFAHSDTGGFRVQDTPAGEYAVRVEFSTSPEALADVRGIIVRGGQTTQAPPIDLRERLVCVRVELVDEHDTPLVDGSVCASRDGARLRAAEAGPDGVAVLPLDVSTCDVAASAPGFRPKRALGVSGHVRLVLARGFVARLRGPVLDPIASDYDLRLNFWLKDEERDTCFRRSVMCLLGADGRGTSTFGVAGVYELGDARLVRRLTGTEFELGLDPFPTVTIAEDDLEHVVEVPDAALRAAVDRALGR